MGLRPRETDELSKRQHQRTSWALVLTFVFVLLALQVRQIRGATSGQIERVLQESFQQAELVGFDIRADDPLQILATIRQAVENFNLEKTTSQILTYMGKFQKQWDSFIVSMEKMGKRLDDTQKEYAHLITTRKNLLEKPLQEIDKIRKDQGIPLEPDHSEFNSEGAGEDPEEQTLSL